MGFTYAHISEKDAYLSGEFGESMARRYFGDEIVDSMPRYVRGKRKGQLKGRLVWEKVVKGGWVKTGRYCHDSGRASGYVERRVGKVIKVELMLENWGDKPTPVAKWEWYRGDERDKAILHVYREDVA